MEAPRFPLEHVVQEHMKAWSALADSTMAVMSLPVRTVQSLLGAPPAAPPTPEERLAAAEAAVDELKAALAREWARHREAEAVWHARLQAELGVIQELKRAYAQLEQEAEGRVSQAIEDQKQAFYRTMEPLLTQLPVVRRSIDQGREVAAPDLLALLGPLDEVLGGWGFTAIGVVGETAAFDPTQHQMTRGAAPEPGAKVVVKHVGYRLGEQILRRARVASG